MLWQTTDVWTSFLKQRKQTKKIQKKERKDKKHGGTVDLKESLTWEMETVGCYSDVTLIISDSVGTTFQFHGPHA